MSATDPPLCPICNAKHWSREPHQFAKPLSAITMAAKGILAKPKRQPGKPKTARKGRKAK